MKGMKRKYWRAAFGKRARERLTAALKKLSLYCRAPDLRAKEATDLDEAMKQFTWWPKSDFLKQIEDSVLTLASTERKNPSRRIWKAFEIVNKRMPKLHLVKEINALAKRAKERLTDAGWSKLEEISWDALGEKGKDVQSLLHDIARMKENLDSAKAIDWSQHKRLLSQFSGGGEVELACGRNTASDEVRCYTRALELIVDDNNFEPLRKESRPLVEWLIEIGHPEGFEGLHTRAAMAVFMRKLARERANREAKWAKFQQSKRVIKRSKEDAEDVRLMMLVGAGKADALAELRKRHERWVKGVARKITRSNSTADDILQKTFIQVWKHAPEYVPTAKFRTWLTEIVKNLALNEMNRAKKVFAHVSETGSKGRKKNDITGGSAEFSSWPGEDSSMEDSEKASELPHIGENDHMDHLMEALPGALSQLPEREQRVLRCLWGVDCEPKTREALAAELGTTVCDVERLEQEAKKKVRRILSDS